MESVLEKTIVMWLFKAMASELIGIQSFQMYVARFWLDFFLSAFNALNSI